MEDIDFKKIMITWVCYSAVLTTSLFISASLCLNLLEPSEFENVNMFNIFVGTTLLTLFYRLKFEGEEYHIQKMESTIEIFLYLIDLTLDIILDIFRLLFFIFLFFNIFKLPITILNFMIMFLIFLISLIII